MKYYKLSMDMERDNDVICYCEDDFGIQQNTFNVGKKYEGCNNEFCFVYDKNEGSVATDFLANDKGWFLISDRLKKLLETLNTEIQYLPVRITEKNGQEELSEYFIANIIRVVNALCLEKSKYFQTEIPGIGIIYTVSKYGIFESKTSDSDVFKLANRQEIPIFVSERFKEIIEQNKIIGISLREIDVQ